MPQLGMAITICKYDYYKPIGQPAGAARQSPSTWQLSGRSALALRQTERLSPVSPFGLRWQKASVRYDPVGLPGPGCRPLRGWPHSPVRDECDGPGAPGLRRREGLGGSASWLLALPSPFSRSAQSNAELELPRFRWAGLHLAVHPLPSRAPGRRSCSPESPEPPGAYRGPQQTHRPYSGEPGSGSFVLSASSFPRLLSSPRDENVD